MFAHRWILLLSLLWGTQGLFSSRRVHGPAGSRLAPRFRPLLPRASTLDLNVPVALNGGDIWAGFALTGEELDDLVSRATLSKAQRPIMMQYHPDRAWLWRQWMGTIVRSVRKVWILNVLFAAACVAAFQFFPDRVMGRVAAVNSIWKSLAGLVSFVLSFFLNKAYTVWSEVYLKTRIIQGRLNDIGLLCAANAQRQLNPDSNQWEYTPASRQLLLELGRYCRLFNLLFYATVSRKYAPLQTPAGLKRLVMAQEMTEEERDRVQDAGTNHNQIIVWISAMLQQAIRDGTLRGGEPLSINLMRSLAELRQNYAAIPDKLSGRMPLAYSHFVQLLIDVFVLMTPIATYHVMGPAAIFATALLTIAYSGMLDLAKMLLDPFDNEDFGGRSGVFIEIDTLVQETNSGSRRWMKGGDWMPPMTQPKEARRAAAEAAAAKERAETASKALEIEEEMIKVTADVDRSRSLTRDYLETLSEPAPPPLLWRGTKENLGGLPPRKT